MSDQREIERSNSKDPGASPGLRALETSILLTRWFQLPLLLGLVFVLVVFEFAFARHLIALLAEGGPLKRDKVILVTLDLIDMVLIANLVVMVIISGYKLLISPLFTADESRVPIWLRSATPSELKLRIATTVLLISTIHLLHMFLDPSASAEHDTYFILIAQGAFALTTLVFVAVDYVERQHR